MLNALFIAIGDCSLSFVQKKINRGNLSLKAFDPDGAGASWNGREAPNFSEYAKKHHLSHCFSDDPTK